MSAQFNVIAPGVLATIQDIGRSGYRRIGVPQSGALHPDLAYLANALVDNPVSTAVLEFFLIGPTLQLTEGSAQVALSGDFTAELRRGSKTLPLTSWRSITLQAGDLLKIGPLVAGKVGYLAVTGGLRLTPVMGSCSTYLRGEFGGIDGHRLLAGSRLELLATNAPQEPDRQLSQSAVAAVPGLIIAAETEGEPQQIRVIWGPQEDYFTSASRDLFVRSSYRISRDSDRMGSRLEGTQLDHDPERGSEIISDGIVPGAIQVPGNGAPIVLLADGPTVGGYPKIATVISVDLPILATLQPGRSICFRAVSTTTAEKLLRHHRQQLAALVEQIVPIATDPVVPAATLNRINLISGVVDGRRDSPEVPVTSDGD